ncbi:SMI1/KNR4 family protein, partial [Nocardia cyriacigeorgica]|uniref:SMI1/KNR4 family protein n=1 Tax=Nocardia cyriacigeorgica TaxID=135487 RepID=UPI0032AF4ED5
MHPLLTRLDRWLMLNRPAYRAGLRPGASADAIDALAARFEGRFPPLLRELLGWHDGEGADHRGALLGTWSLMSTDSIESTLADMAWLVDNDDMAEWWGPDWIPFLDNGWGDCVCVDLAGAFDGVAGQIVEFSHDSEYRSITHPGLEAWLFTIVRGFEDGIFALDCHAGVGHRGADVDAAQKPVKVGQKKRLPHPHRAGTVVGRARHRLPAAGETLSALGRSDVRRRT